MRLAPGDSFDRYVIESLLGEGGTGEVYGAKDTRLRRKVALKVLRDLGEGDPEAWDRQVALMLREARAAAGLNHPSIVAIFDVGEHQGIPYIAMEVALGKPLRELIGAGVPLAERLRILLEVAHALAAAHRAGLVHRDVKPENVIVRDDGSVKVLDFGIARPTRASAVPGSMGEDRISSLTDDDMFEGTPAYMSPERVRGDDIDARADQFAWGVVAFELLAGKLPFRGERGPATLLSSILSDTPAPLEGVPEGVNALVQRTLAKEPDDRFATMDDVVSELSALVPEEPPAVEEPRESVRSRGLDARFLPAIVAAVLLVAAVFVASWSYVRPRQPGLRIERLVAQTSFAPTPITSLPDPPSQNREAIAAYREGLEALRRADWETARVAYERAASLDPSLGVAHLHVAITLFWQRRDGAREALRKAILHRGTLSERDWALLDVHEPLIQREPPDRLEALRRLSIASARFPGDVEIMNLHQFFKDVITPEHMLDRQERCVELDPEHADCWQGKARALVRVGRMADALAAVDRCIALAPRSGDCLYERLVIDKIDGDCGSLERHARAWLAEVPDSPFAYDELAIALYGQGRPTVEVRAAVDQAVSWRERQGNAVEGQILLARFAILTGDLAGAEKILRALQADIKDVLEEAAHASIAARLVDILEETGRQEEAAQEANAYLMNRSVLLTPWLYSAWGDETMLFWRAQLQTDRLSRREYENERQRFLERWSSPFSEKRAAAWFMGYAMPAITSEDAREALEVAPYLGADDDHGNFGSEKALAAWLHGKTRVLDGDAAGALADLVVATADCNALGEPMRHTRAQLFLGIAREATGEREKACAAYDVVIERWGKNSMSRTAREAAKRARALGCDVKGP
ncbi:serine/threonine-protein kinase [Polyangium aurulentum]|uniref:serine/threonine-protein kinase n=1 Tax=Polyangium aurulentum TaxID=2567896 RepID=UPI0010ADC2B1|nr:serine/threonine-protein kinase [Polyangium aurulentum]UQA60876.1 protein kinase [Polyangium aurulentum]